MKFWKWGILTALAFCGIVFFTAITSCEKNVCDNVICEHGGSCRMGICNCPVGYEGARCQTLMTDRYLGKYVGYTSCDNLAPIYDTVLIEKDYSDILNVTLKVKSVTKKLLRGYVESSASTYRIVITNNDSTSTDTTFYKHSFSVTLQGDKMLTVHSYEKAQSPTDSVAHECTFVTERKL